MTRTEYCYSPFFGIRPVPQPGTPICFIGGASKGHRGIYRGKDAQGRHTVELTNGNLVSFSDPRHMQLVASA